MCSSSVETPAVAEKTASKCLEIAADVTSFLRLLKLDNDEILCIEELTRGQKESKWWSIFRRHRLTASNFSTFLSCKKKGSLTLSKTALNIWNGSGMDISTLSAARWGIEHEEIALQVYSQSTGEKVSRRGLQLHTSGFLGASVDGVSSTGVIIEVKCPFNSEIREKGPVATLGTNASYFRTTDLQKENVCQRVVILKNGHKVCFLSNDAVHLKSTGQGKKYFHQIQGQLFICDKQSCDLVVWTPSETVVLRICRDRAWESENVPVLNAVYRAFAETLF